MRPPCERDKVQFMLDQLIDAYMANDDARYDQALRWLCQYVDRVRVEQGRVRRGGFWTSPGLPRGGRPRKRR